VRLPVWLMSMVSVLVGAEVAHSLAYRAAHPSESAREHELVATGHGYLAAAPLAVALALAVAVVALLLRLGAARRGAAAARVSALPFALLGPLVFVFQEYGERLVHDGAFPWAAALQSSFVLGLCLQAPFALLAWLVARCLLATADVLARVLAAQPSLVVAGPPSLRAGLAFALPRLPLLAAGWTVRGPPAHR
jgi:hypothetical protein